MMNFRLPFLGLLLLFSLLQLMGQESLKIGKIEFYGNDSISDETLLKFMNTKPRLLLDKLEFWKKGAYLSQNTLNEDIYRLKKYYQKNGFLEPILTYDIVPNKKNKRVKIDLHITEGEPIVNRNINFYYIGDSSNQNRIDSIKIALPLKSRRSFRDDDVLASEKIILDFYRNNGHPNATVLTNLSLNEDLNIVDINFNIDTGLKTSFGNVILLGDSLIPRSYINKRINIYSGEEYSQTKLDKTQQELINTGLFKYITVKTNLDSIKDGRVPISIRVKEMPRWAFKIGLGYGTEDRIRISFLLTRLNFFGGGRTFIFKGQHSFFVPLGLDLKFIQPDVVFKNLDFILNPFFSWEREESYEVKRIGTAITFEKKFTKKTSAYLSYNLGIDRVFLSTSSWSASGDTLANEQNNKSGLTLGFNHRTTDDLFSPTKGWKFSTMATYMGIGFNSQYHYYKIISEGDCFLPIGRQIVLACKVKGGIIQPIQGDLSSPIEDRFLMGGALSLRGWGRNLISPINEEGLKTGGNTMLDNSVELRFPIYGVISGAAFIDFGNVWENPWHFNLSEMLYDYGLGLRIKSPVGPIRFDVATPFVNQKFNAQFFITIGHAF